MLSYKELYLKMFRASEQAIQILITAQRECEEQYILAGGSERKVTRLSFQKQAGDVEE